MLKPYEAAREALDKAVQELWRAQEYYSDLTFLQKADLVIIRTQVIDAKQRLEALLAAITGGERIQ